MPFTFADAASASLPLYVVPADGVDEHQKALPHAQAQWLRSTGFKGKLGELCLLPDADGGVAGAVFGYGTAKERSRGRFHIAKAAGALPAEVWHLVGDLDPEEMAEASLGWLLSGYRFDRYRKSEAKPGPRLKAPAGIDVTRIEAIAAGEVLTRDLINTPASDLGPDELETAFMALANRHGATATAIRGDELIAGNFPMIHAVGRASTRAPRLLDMRWGDAGPALTLVGKGVCFDTGGLDLKPASSMLLMKKDMGGAATVMGLAQMIMTLALPIRLRVLIPAVENSVSGNAMRPGDILTSRKGLTVEVNNTDAEGRLVLADALALADEEAPDLVISMATLTGAARVAVGPDLAPFYSDSEAFVSALQGGATEARDPVWRMPFHMPYETMIEPGIADLDNAPSGGFAGSITAALFLRRFVEASPYAHFDIFGHQPTAAPARPKGAVGQGARAILAALPQALGI